MGAVGLSTYIWGNNTRSLLLLAGFPVLLIFMVWGLEFAFLFADTRLDLAGLSWAAGRATRDLAVSIPGAIVVAGIWFAIAYAFNGVIIDIATGSKRVTREEEPVLWNLLENLCISRGLPMPQLKIMEREEMNAFASGLHPGRFSVSVTRGLLKNLTEPELEAVLAHEMTHIMNRDVRTMVIASVFAGIITLIAQMIFRGLQYGALGRARGGGRSGGGALVFVLIALLVAAIGYALALVIRMAISRQREFVADAGAVELTRNPDAMISALTKISGQPHLDAPESVRAMFLHNHEAGVMGLFATHPPVEARIDALVKFAGGTRPPEPEPALDALEPPPTADAGPWSAPPAATP